MTVADELRRTLDVVFRRESPRIVAALLRHVRDVGTAEQCAQDAFVAALEQWPTTGVPDEPGAWLLTAARRRALDLRRREVVQREHAPELAHAARQQQQPGAGLECDADAVGDDLLRLMFLCCHPVLPPEARSALTLRLVAGLTTVEIARAQLVPVTTIAQRLVRAKRTLAELGELAAPDAEQRAGRLVSVLEVLYLVFNEGYTRTAGEHWQREELCEEALRLGRVLATLLPLEAEVHGLVALMELQASRSFARTGPAGEPVLLDDQDRSRWDRAAIRRGLAALEAAARLGSARGPYVLQAELAACHARAAVPAATDWRRIVQLYGELLQIAPSPIVALNRAVAVGRAFGPDTALPLVDRLAADGVLADYHLLPSVRGDLLEQLGRSSEAAEEFTRAAAMAANQRERELLQRRALVARRRAGP